MAPTLNHHSMLTQEKLSSGDEAMLLDCARSLMRATQAGSARSMLRGKKLGLLCEAEADPEASLFQRAAVELGAHVAHLRPSLTVLTSADEIRYTARMLGRLYDAVNCEGLPMSLVLQVSEGAGIPVFSGLASSVHPTALLATRIDGHSSADDKRLAVLQATLLSSIP